MDPRDATHLKMITPQLSTFCIFEDSPFTSLLQILVWARQLQFSAFSLFSSVPYNGIKLVVHGLCCWSHIYIPFLRASDLCIDMCMCNVYRNDEGCLKCRTTEWRLYSSPKVSHCFTADIVKQLHTRSTGIKLLIVKLQSSLTVQSKSVGLGVFPPSQVTSN